MKNGFISLALVSALFVGCSSLSSSNNASSNNINLNGNVADGYLIGATVCIDENMNLACDVNETTTTTGENGYYIFEDINSTDYPIVVEVTDTTIDSDTNDTVSEPYTLSTNSKHGGFISPITTMVNEYYLSHADNNVTIEEVRDMVALELGLESTDDLFTDYMVDGNISELTQQQLEERRELRKELHSVAKLLVYTKHEVRDIISVALEDTNTSDMKDNHEALCLMSNEHIFKHMKDIRSKAKNMDWKNEGEYELEGSNSAFNMDLNSSSLYKMSKHVDGFKKHRKKKIEEVSGTVSTGSIE